MPQSPSSAEPFRGFPLAVTFQGGLVLVALVLAWLLRVELREFFPHTSSEWQAAIGRGLLATLPMLAMFWGLSRSSHREIQRLRRQVESAVVEIFPTASYAQFALISALAGVGEEMLFRGVIQSSIQGWTTPWVGLAVASLLFGAVHALSRLYFVIATLIGAYLGWLFLHDDDLVAPIVAHAVYDFLALIYIAKHLPLKESRPSSEPPTDESTEANESTSPHDD